MYCYQGGAGRTEGLRCITAVEVKQENIIGCKKKKSRTLRWVDIKITGEIKVNAYTS